MKTTWLYHNVIKKTNYSDMKHSNDTNQEEEKFKEGFGFIILIVVITIALLTILKCIIG